jgi:hypothetical protein
VEIVYEHTDELCARPFLHKQLQTWRRYEPVVYRGVGTIFNVARICTSGAYTQQWVSKLHDYWCIVLAGLVQMVALFRM